MDQSVVVGLFVFVIHDPPIFSQMSAEEVERGLAAFAEDFESTRRSDDLSERELRLGDLNHALSPVERWLFATVFKRVSVRPAAHLCEASHGRNHQP